MKPPRSRGSTLPVTIAIAATIRPALLTIRSETAATATSSPALGRFVRVSIIRAEHGAIHPVDAELARPVGPPADHRRA